MSIAQRVSRFTKPIFNKKRYKGYYKSTTSFIKKRPFAAFFIALGLLFAVILLGNILSRPKAVAPLSAQKKMVTVYNIGETPKVTFQAKIDKTGVVKIVALTGGVVEGISVAEGDSVWEGEQLVNLSSNYSGGNALGLSSQIAQASYKNMLTQELLALTP